MLSIIIACFLLCTKLPPARIQSNSQTVCTCPGICLIPATAPDIHGRTYRSKCRCQKFLIVEVEFFCYRCSGNRPKRTIDTLLFAILLVYFYMPLTLYWYTLPLFLFLKTSLHCFVALNFRKTFSSSVFSNTS